MHERNSTWTGGWHLAVHNSGQPPNGHDFLLHRRHKAQPRELSLRLTAALFEDEGVLRDREADRALSEDHRMRNDRNRVLLIVHGFDHTRDDYELQAAVLALSRRSWLLSHVDVLLVVNNLAVATDSLISALRRYPGALRMLVHTSLDAGHQCSEVQLLAATTALWQRYPWVVYASGPDEHITPAAIDRIGALLQKPPRGVAVFADRFPGPPGPVHGGPLVFDGRVRRYALDVIAFRTAPLRRTGAWWNATAVCTAHRIYPGLPETVLSWMSVAHNLTFAPLGTPSLVRPLAKNREGPCGEGCDGGVWHSHDAAAVREWLREAARR